MSRPQHADVAHPPVIEAPLWLVWRLTALAHVVKAVTTAAVHRLVLGDPGPEVDASSHRLVVLAVITCLVWAGWLAVVAVAVLS